MNILIISHGIPSEKDPQWGCFELDQARALMALGHRVNMVAVDARFRSKERRFGYRHQVFDGVDACSFFLFPIGLLRIAWLRIWVRDLMMLSLFRHMERLYGLPDVIYAHFSQWAGYAGTILSEKYGVPLVTLEHFSQLIDDHPPTVLMDCVKQTMEKSQYFLCVSEKLKESLTGAPLKP